MAKIIEGRVRQKAATLAEWNNINLPSLDGEQLFVRSDVDGKVIGFKMGTEGKPFSQLEYPDFTVRDKATPSKVWADAPSGVYVPIETGVYNGVQVTLADGYQVLYWDGATLTKTVYPSDYRRIDFGGVISPGFDLSNPEKEVWYFAKPGTYNTVPPITLTDDLSILTWDGTAWSHTPVDFNVEKDMLVFDTIADLRAITDIQKQYILSGEAKGAIVNGYYTADDTPSPLNYYVSSSTAADDGGSIIIAGSLRFEHKFVGTLDVRYFGAKPNVVQDSKPYIIKAERYAADNSVELLIDRSSTYYITLTDNMLGGGVELHSNVNMRIDGHLKCYPNKFRNYSLVSVNNATNVNIYGKGSITGDKDSHLSSVDGTTVLKERKKQSAYVVGDRIYINTTEAIVTQAGTTDNALKNSSYEWTLGQVITDGTCKYQVTVIGTGDTALGEWGMGITLYKAENVNIKDISILNCWGDGMYIGGRDGTFNDPITSESQAIPCRSINIDGIKISGSRRQGMSIVCADGVNVVNSTIEKTSGTNPQACVDIEPNRRTPTAPVQDRFGYCRNISFLNCNIKNAATVGFNLYQEDHNSLTAVQYIDITGCTFEGHGSSNIATRYCSEVTVDGNTFKTAGDQGAGGQVSLSGVWVYFTKNTVDKGTSSAGITGIRCYSDTLVSIIDISGNLIKGTGTHAIRNQGPDKIVNVKGNTIAGTWTNVFGQASDTYTSEFNAEDNDIRCTSSDIVATTDATTSFGRLSFLRNKISGTNRRIALRSHMINTVIKNNTFYGMTTRVIDATSVNDFTIEANRFENCSGAETLYMTQCTRGLLRSNTFIKCGNSAGVIYATNSNVDCEVSANTLLGDSYTTTGIALSGTSYEFFNNSIKGYTTPTTAASTLLVNFGNIYNGVPVVASSVRSGMVKQSTAVTNSTNTPPSDLAGSTATDVAGIVSDFNAMAGKFNALLALANDLQSKLNAKLAADRTSGQQVT